MNQQVTILIVSEQTCGFANEIRVQNEDFSHTGFYRYDAFCVEHVGGDDVFPADHPARAKLMADKRAELDAAGSGMY